MAGYGVCSIREDVVEVPAAVLDEFAIDEPLIYGNRGVDRVEVALKPDGSGTVQIQRRVDHGSKRTSRRVVQHSYVVRAY